MRWNRKKVFTALVALATLSIFLKYLMFPQSNTQLYIPKRISSSWHQAFNTTYLYSAYWDDRDEPHVKIIAIGSYDERLSSVKCYVMSQGTKITEAHAIFSIVDFENHGRNHTPVFFYCYPANKKKPTKVRISIMDGRNSAWLPVRNFTPSSDVSNKMAICVRPLFGQFPNNNIQVAEFVALYQLLGVEHFVFYNYDINNNLLRLLRELSSLGISMEILPWDIPESLENSWEKGQVASITDCVYRMGSSYEYVLVLDLDEFIIPHKNLTLKEIVKSLTDLTNFQSASYLFRHIFFCLDYPDKHPRLPLLTQTVTIRKELLPWIQRTKAIYRPLAIVMPGIHKPLITYDKWNPLAVVSPEIATLHHYRGGVCSLWNKWGYGIVRDKTAFKYRTALLESAPVRKWLQLYSGK